MIDTHPDIQELLIRRATEGLDEADTELLRARLAEEGIEDDASLDLAAAAAANAFAVRSAEESADAPGHLKARLMDDAEQFFARDNVVELPQRTKRFEWGWAVAAGLAVLLVGSRLVDAPETAPIDARDALMADAGSVVIEWATPESADYAAVSGDVVWNDARQEGYMLLSNMPVNDPSVSQYQLWVVDPDRDEQPVDGGVFDIPLGDGPVVIPINAKLDVNRPVAFAITREQPGGVVVSDGPLLVVAQAG